MSIQLMSSVFNAQIGDGENSSASARKLVLLAMADYAAEDGSGVYPSRSTLCRKTALSTGAMNYAIRSLVKDRHIKRVGQRKKTGVVVYVLNVKKIREEQFGPENTTSTIEVPPPQPLTGPASTIEDDPLGNHQVNPLEGDAKTAPLTPEQQTAELTVIRMVKKITGRRNIPTELWESLCDTLTSKPDEARLRECWISWLARGYRRDNYAWALDWYKNGIPNQGKNGKQTSRDLPAIGTTDGGFYA